MSACEQNGSEMEEHFYEKWLRVGWVLLLPLVHVQSILFTPVSWELCIILKLESSFFPGTGLFQRWVKPRGGVWAELKREPCFPGAANAGCPRARRAPRPLDTLGTGGLLRRNESPACLLPGQNLHSEPPLQVPCAAWVPGVGPSLVPAGWGMVLSLSEWAAN